MRPPPSCLPLRQLRHSPPLCRVCVRPLHRRLSLTGLLGCCPACSQHLRGVRVGARVLGSGAGRPGPAAARRRQRHLLARPDPLCVSITLHQLWALPIAFPLMCALCRRRALGQARRLQFQRRCVPLTRLVHSGAATSGLAVCLTYPTCAGSGLLCPLLAFAGQNGRFLIYTGTRESQATTAANAIKLTRCVRASDCLLCACAGAPAHRSRSRCAVDVVGDAARLPPRALPSAPATFLRADPALSPYVCCDAGGRTATAFPARSATTAARGDL